MVYVEITEGRILFIYKLITNGDTQMYRGVMDTTGEGYFPQECLYCKVLSFRGFQILTYLRGLKFAVRQFICTVTKHSQFAYKYNLAVICRVLTSRSINKTRK